MAVRVVVALLALAPAAARAEVGDKVPTQPWLWGAVAVFVAMAVLLETARLRLGLVVVPVAILWAMAGHVELSSPDLGPAIRTELGDRHVLWSYAAFAAGALGPLTVGIAGRRLRRRRPVAGPCGPRPGIGPSRS